MRVILWIRYILCFLCIVTSSYSSQSDVPLNNSVGSEDNTVVPEDNFEDPVDNTDTTTARLAQQETFSPKTTKPKANALEAWHVFPLDVKKIFFGFAPVYGSLSDGGASATGYAEISQPSGNTKNYIPKVGVNWGWQGSLGYALADDYRYAFITSFFALSGSRVSSVNMLDGSTLLNELTQLGTIGNLTNFGFSTFYGNASASSTASIKYQRLDFKLQEPWSLKDDPTDVFHFYKIKGLMIAGINKALSGYYTGDILLAGTTTSISPGTDSMLYASNSYGVGPELGMLAFAHLFDRIKIRVEGESAFLIGYFNSHYREYGTALKKVDVGDVSGKAFSNKEDHPSSSWTPIFFDVQSTIDGTLWRSKKTHTEFIVGGGVGIEYILPTFTGDEITQPLGNPLLKFNNNLSISYIIMRAALTGDL